VAFPGERDNVWPILQAFDVFVLASRFEPCSVVLLEAKAACLVVSWAHPVRLMTTMAIVRTGGVSSQPNP
jgi:glycosyltransferase involved in cell wall biosynthesis